MWLICAKAVSNVRGILSVPTGLERQALLLREAQTGGAIMLGERRWYEGGT